MFGHNLAVSAGFAKKHEKAALKFEHSLHLTFWIAEGPQLLASTEKVVDRLACVASFVTWLNGFDKKLLSISMEVVTRI